MIAKRPFRKSVQPASVDVGFHLTIPCVSVEVRKPLTQSVNSSRESSLTWFSMFSTQLMKSPNLNGNETSETSFGYPACPRFPLQSLASHWPN